MLKMEDSVLIIIDMQEKLVKAVPDGNKIVNNFTKIAHAADILNIPTLITEQYPIGLGTTVDEIKNTVSLGTFTVEKNSFSAMSEVDFNSAVKAVGKKQAVIGGIETHICVLQTAYDLIKEGIEVYIVKDCTSSRKNEEYEAGLELLKQYGARIATVEIVLFEWLKTSKHCNFKEIQNLIK